MEDLEQRLDYLEETNDMLLMQNRVLAAAFAGLFACHAAGDGGKHRGIRSGCF